MRLFRYVIRKSKSLLKRLKRKIKRLFKKSKRTTQKQSGIEKVTNNDFSKLTNNKIILENCDLKLKKSRIQFNGEGNVIVFRGAINSDQRRVLLEKSEIICLGNNNLVFIHASKHALKISIKLGHGCNVYIGENLYSATPTHIITNERANIVIGELGLFGNDVWLRTSDMHMIYDIESRKRINPNKDIFIGRHVWLGQDVTCLKGTIVGSGSCVGLGSLISNDNTKEANAIYVGRPAKLVRSGITWRIKGTNTVLEEEMDNETYQTLDDDEYIYDSDEELAKIEEIKSNLSGLRDMEERIAYLKSIWTYNLDGYYLAIDIGASSGRHILGYVENGRIVLEEIHRFENYITDENGTLVWDINHLVDEIKAGIAKCKTVGKIPNTIAIDTWGVDYVLLDENKQEIMPAVSYRDSRTFDVMDEVAALISNEELYERTGIQKQNYNTIYQLYCDKKSGKLDKAKHLLMMPSYLSFKLTGVMKNEYTHASTTNLINAQTKTWDHEILDKLGIKKDIFSDISLPCTEVGNFTEEVKNEIGFDSTVIFCPSHDTASAVAACSIGDNGVYISSGTWSLIGTENPEAVLSKEAFEANFANEGGINYHFRFLKNIMGMWLLQNIKKNLNRQLSYDDMMNMAMQSEAFEEIDTNAPNFLAPENMIDAIRNYLKNDRLPIEVVINTVYHSLAKSYANAVREIEEISGKTIDTINIVGGVSKDSYLNELTKQYTGKRVLAGPVEATATGNIISQMMFADKELTLEKARKLVKTSFNITEEM